MLPRFGIRNKLFLSILLILVLSYSTLVYTTVISLYATLEEDIDKELATDLKYLQSQYKAHADLMKYSLMQPASSDLIQRRLVEQDKVWLKDAMIRWENNLPFIDTLAIVDTRKQVVARVFSNRSGDTYGLRGVIDTVFRLKRPVISTELVSKEFLCNEGNTSYCTSKVGSEAMLTVVAVPCIAPKGQLLGAIVAGDIINNDPHLPFQVQEIFGKEVEVAITQRGLRIASSLSDDKLIPATISPAILARLEKGQTYRGVAAIGDKFYETVFAPIRNSGGEVVGSFSVALSKGHIKKIRHDNLRNILASAIVGIVLSFLLAYVAARRLAGPLRELAAGARRIETGDLSQRVDIRQMDEIGMLANSFNRMADALAEHDRIIGENTGELRELNEQLEKKVAERTAELRIEMGRLEAILTSMVEGVVVTDRDNQVILCNPAAQKIFDLVPHRVLNRPIEEACKVGEFCVLIDYIREMREEGGFAVSREAEAEAKGKKLKANIAPLLDDGGSFAGAVMSVRDITLEEEVDRMKTEFISTVSHELKTPLTSIKGSLQYIMNRGQWPTDTERELLSICLRNTERLIRLINDILDISKIESGKMEFSLKPQNIGELVRYAIEEISGFAMNRNVALNNYVGTDLPRIYGDHDRLIRVLTNLLSNAVKFSPLHKIVVVSAKREGNYVAVSVIDQGETIRWVDRDKLFRRFQQLHAVGAAEGGGTGLGLAICKEIIERHHGKIYYQEGTGGGNVFTFTVPIYEEY
ncbi:MAG TPA: ATP-binding protein [Geobacteraceae bacterium]|nr:ATP-binding protein [Geobacteraceae bacterium]